MNPINEFLNWFEEARAAGVPEPAAMALATCVDNRPSVRMVLYRGVSAGALRFFTNYESRKGRELEANAHAAAVFHWEPLRRQVRFEGSVERLPAVESDQYFAARPRGHQLGAWASRQSEPMTEAELRSRYGEAEERFAGGPVLRPPHWGGYRLLPVAVELWTGREDRMHERARYEMIAPTDEAGEVDWRVTRLGP